MNGEGSSNSLTKSARYVESSPSSFSQSSHSFITWAGNRPEPSLDSAIGSSDDSRSMISRT